MEQKTYTAPLEFKADGKPGEFKAVFATFNVKDLHGDWTIPGAFYDGQEAFVEGWNHDYTLPVGKGIVKSDGNEAWVEGEFFIDTQAGKDHYTVAKNADKLTQWSYTFDVLDASPTDDPKYDGADRLLKQMDIVGFAPVTRGAGINTRTTAIKTADKGDDDKSAPENEGEADTGKLSVNDALKARIDLAEINLIMRRLEI